MSSRGTTGGTVASPLVELDLEISEQKFSKMADDKEAEIRELELRIDNLRLAASYRGVPQDVTVTYLKELQRLRGILGELRRNSEGDTRTSED